MKTKCQKGSVAEAIANVRWDMTGVLIEQESFRTIAEEFSDILARFPEGERRVARRLIHTTADPEIAGNLHFHGAPVQTVLHALSKKAPVFCDSNMIRAGLSLAKLQRINPAYASSDIFCHIADEDVARKARETGRTRALVATEKALPIIDGAIVLVGNAPLALARIARAVLCENIRPALVVGMPVGFVNVVEAKALIEMCDVPQVVLGGRRGGSTLAVATMHALLEEALAARNCEGHPTVWDDVDRNAGR